MCGEQVCSSFWEILRFKADDLSPNIAQIAVSCRVRENKLQTNRHNSGLDWMAIPSATRPAGPIPTTCGAEVCDAISG